MMPFLCVATLSTLLMFAAGRPALSGKGALSLALVVAAALVPAVAAGVRNVTVGTDVGHYLVFMAADVPGESLAQYLAHYSGDSAAGFNVLLWASCRLGGLPFAMFAIQLACAAPCYAEFWRQDPRRAWVGVLVYCLVLFPPSLNAMKQFVALGVCLFCFRFVAARRPVPFVLGTLAAMLFHQTAVLNLVAYPAYLLVQRFETRYAGTGSWKRAVPALAAAALFAAAFALFPIAVGFLSHLKDSYALLAEFPSEGLNKTALVMLAIVAICAFSACRGVPRLEEASPLKPGDVAFFALMACAGLAAFQLNMLVSTLARVGFYALVFMPCFVQALASFEDRSVRVVTAMMLAFCCAYLFMVAATGGYGVYPFTLALPGVA